MQLEEKLRRCGTVIDDGGTRAFCKSPACRVCLRYRSRLMRNQALTFASQQPIHQFFKLHFQLFSSDVLSDFRRVRRSLRNAIFHEQQINRDRRWNEIGMIAYLASSCDVNGLIYSAGLPHLALNELFPRKYNITISPFARNATPYDIAEFVANIVRQTGNGKIDYYEQIMCAGGGFKPVSLISGFNERL